MTPWKLIAPALIIPLIALSACSRSEKFDPGPFEQVKAPAKVEDSFTVFPALLRPNINGDRTSIAIAKNSLEKEFLLRSSIITQVPAPLGSGLKTRVVAFRRHDGKIYMLEAAQGHSVTDELPQNLVLAAFPIISEGNDWITFDFNRGMSHLFTYEDWHSSNDKGTYSTQHFLSAQVRFSYLEGAAFTRNNSLSIRQVAQLSTAENGITKNTPVEIRYLIHPYMPSPDYNPQRAADGERVGFFEIMPQILKNGREVIFASRFHPQKPIVFAISHNTPKDFHAAVRDGILYWNKAFGAEILKVIDAPKGASAPNHTLNMVQWIPHNNMGFAYADAQMDPRTGEILQAQVFLSSVFAETGKWNAERILNRQENEHLAPTLMGFHSGRMCNRALDASVAKGLAALQENGASEQAVLLAAQDYVREVVAHEIGHTLGLRHNFAASVDTDIQPEDIPALLKQYIASGQISENIVPHGSVMDYNTFTHSVLAGSRMRQDAPALPYDQMAINVLYRNQSVGEKGPLFCTDHLAYGDYADCRPEDQGTSFLRAAQWSSANLAKTVPEMLVQRYRSAKFGMTKSPIPVKKVKLPDTETLAASIEEEREVALTAITKDAKILRVRQQFTKQDDSNEDAANQKERLYLIEELKRLGGIEQIFPTLDDDFEEQAQAQLDAILARRAADFSPEERSHILETAKPYWKRLAASLVKHDLELLEQKKGKKKIADDEIGNAFASLLKSRLEKYAFSAQNEEKKIEIKVPARKDQPEKTLEASLPEFIYPLETRLIAAALFGNDRGEAVDWGFRERLEVQERFVNTWKSSLGTIPEEVPLPQAPNEVVRWVLENVKVAEALDVSPEQLKD